MMMLRAGNGQAAIVAAMAAVLMMGATALAEEQDFSPEQIEYFELNVRPLLAEHCYECHSVQRDRSGLRLDSLSGVLSGGEGGPAVEPGEPDRSRLIRGVRYRDVNFQMPPNYRLEDEEIAILEEWVAMGAPWPDEPEPDVDADVPFEEVIERLVSTHWSFQPVERPDLPEVENDAWVRNPIDRFIAERLEEQGLEPSPEADRRTLIRRAYFDLIGLPPTYEEVEAFVNDDSPDAWENLIDELLASPHYGERWGRHWLDIARYGDTTGYIPGNAPRRYPYSYTYRDYVINAFNDDKPFNEFIVEQLAADKLGLEDENKEALAAMGFLTVGRRFQNNIHDITDDRIDVTTRGFMGLTVSCARCHDHIYDPVPTADYYSMYGIFRSSHEPGELPLIDDNPESDPQYESYMAGLQEIRDRKNAWLEERRVEKEHEFRSHVGDYLAYQAEQRTGGDPSRNDGRVTLLRNAIRDWSGHMNRLAERAGEDPVWHLWFELEGIDAGGFADAAAAVLEREPEIEVNPLLLNALQEASPESMIDVARVYGDTIEDIYQQWRERTQDVPEEQRPDALEDPHAEQLRQVVMAEDSPATVSGRPDRFLDQQERGRLNQFRGEMEEYTARTPGAPARAMIMEDRNDLFDPAVFRRGQAGARGERVPRRFLQALEHVDGGEIYEDSSGRLRMARAIASDDNPLTPRVTVNRIWQHHFGAGIVRTPSDFGTRGERPTHPKLLDWLASELMDAGWTMKDMHRLIMTSAAYRQASNNRPEALERDPDNQLVWKFTRQRLEFEPMRDAILSVTDQLDLTIGGRSVPIHAGEPRRAVYAYLDREDLPGIYRSFDVANPDVTTAARSETTVPQQALFMLNSPFMADQARHLANRAMERADGEEAASTVEAMYQLALSRRPTADEVALAENFIRGDDEALERPDPRWQFGYGRYDPENETVSFEHLPHFDGDRWAGGPEVPDDELSWSQLHAAGGHPGRDNGQAVIRRFVAPASGTIVIDGTLRHPAEQGDGVLGWVVSDRSGELGDWHVHNGEAHAHVPALEVEAGEEIDFIVAPGETTSHDSFHWAPVVRYESVQQGYPGVTAGHQFLAEQDFMAASEESEYFEDRLDIWSQYAQVLLLSNEFVFVD